MGVSHLSPSGTQRKYGQKIVNYKGNHVDIEHDKDPHVYELEEKSVVNYFTREYSFRELDETWTGDNEKVLAETKHGAELRALYHPSGRTVYFYIVIVSKERQKHNLAIQHLEAYHRDLQEVLVDVFDEIKRKKTAWTSETVEVEA